MKTDVAKGGRKLRADEIVLCKNFEKVAFSMWEHVFLCRIFVCSEHMGAGIGYSFHNLAYSWLFSSFFPPPAFCKSPSEQLPPPAKKPFCLCFFGLLNPNQLILS